MTELQLRDAVDLFTKQTSTINSLWQNYSTVTGVLLGFGINAFKEHASDKAALPFGVIAAASVAFAMFSYGNWILIKQACTVQLCLKAAIGTILDRDSEIAPEYARFIKTLDANSVRVSSVYHFVIDFCIFLVLWLAMRGH